MPVIPCPSPPPAIVLGIVTLDVTQFVGAYPEFAGFASGAPLVSPKISNAFALAQLVLNNTCSSRVQDANKRDTLLQLLTAHITFLTYGNDDGAGDANPAPGVIGRIASATEGSITVAAEFGGEGGPTQDWYTSTKYGALYWLSTSGYRTALYIPAPGSGPNGYNAGWPGFGGGCGC